MTRRSLFKRLIGVVAGLCCFGGPAKGESLRRSGSEFICEVPEGCDRLVSYGDTIYTASSTTVYWYNSDIRDFEEVRRAL